MITFVQLYQRPTVAPISGTRFKAGDPVITYDPPMLPLHRTR